jgi:AraC-like DNA-binding protein
MNLLRHQPALPLATWVDCFWYSTAELPPAGTRQRSSARHSALPTGGMDVVFNLHEDSMQVLIPSPSADASVIRTNGSIVHGAQSGYFIIDARARGRTAGIHFRPGGGAVLLGLPATELSGQHVSLSELWGTHATQLRARLVECRTADAVFHTLEQTLLRRLPQLRGPLVHPAISFALRNFSAGAAASRVSPIQEASGYSARRFNTLFQQAVGLAPKRFCRIQRLRAVIEQVARGEPIEWAKVAADNGYFDQSHLTREFRLFSGVTPGQYRPTSRDRALHMELP